MANGFFRYAHQTSASKDAYLTSPAQGGRKESRGSKAVFAVFDRDGNLLQTERKHVELRLRDRTLAQLMGTGLRVGSHFDVAAGTYMLRVVVSETRIAQLSAVSKTLEIPF